MITTIKTENKTQVTAIGHFIFVYLKRETKLNLNLTKKKKKKKIIRIKLNKECLLLIINVKETLLYTERVKERETKTANTYAY